jgi:hypothetical protein
MSRTSPEDCARIPADIAIAKIVPVKIMSMVKTIQPV